MFCSLGVIASVKGWSYGELLEVSREPLKSFDEEKGAYRRPTRKES